MTILIMEKRQFLIALIVIASCAPQISAAQATGSIHGKVANEKGIAIVGARVHATSLDNRPQAGPLAFFTTDERGVFRIPDLAFGKYIVSAEKKSDGYLNTAWFFNTGGKSLVRVDLSAAQPAAEVTITLGPRAARLKGKILDADTGELVTSARFELRRTDKPEYWISTAVRGQFDVLVPSNTEFTLVATANGYGRQAYSATSRSLSPTAIKLKPEQALNFTIKLHRLPRP